MKFNYEPILVNQEKVYQKRVILQKDCLAARKEKDYQLLSKLDSFHRDKPSQVNPKVFERNQTLDWDLIQWADTDFVSWVNDQPPSMILAVMAEMKQSPPLNPPLEKLRQKVKSVPLYSLERYCQEKRLGEKSCQFLKEMKRRYGPSLLRILYLTSG